MAASSSSAQKDGDLPRVDCPKCHLKVIKCLSKKNEVYYKCPNHFMNDSSTCPYYWYEQPYLEYLRANHPDLLNPPTEVNAIAVAEVNDNLTLQMCQLKLLMSEIKVQLGDIAVKIMEVKEEIAKEDKSKGDKSPVFTCRIS